LKKIGIGQAEVDSTKILEDSDCCLVVPAVIAREGVFKYPEGMAFKPAEELRDAAWTAEGAWIVAEKHPDTLILTERKDIKGRVENPRFSSEINGIIADLRLLKKFNAPQFIDDIRQGKHKDVSIGFFYDFDATPGEWKGQKYDFVQRNILVDHVAAGVPLGRCASPYCGIAVDSFIRKVAVDPWEETEEYIRSGHKEPSDTCRTINISEEQGIKAIYCQYGEKWDIQSYLFSKAKEWTMEKAKSWFEEHKEAADQTARALIADQEGELEEKRQAAKDRCGKYPVSFKEGKGNLTKPQEYENVDEDDFADPCNFKYPMVPDDRLVNAWQRLGDEGNRTAGGYSESEWSWMKNRVKKRMEAKGHEVKADALREIERSRQLLGS